MRHITTTRNYYKLAFLKLILNQYFENPKDNKIHARPKRQKTTNIFL